MARFGQTPGISCSPWMGFPSNQRPLWAGLAGLPRASRLRRVFSSLSLLLPPQSKPSPHLSFLLSLSLLPLFILVHLEPSTSRLPSSAMAAPSPRITFSSSPSDRDAAGGSPRLGVGAFDSPHLSIHSTTHSPTSSPRLGGGAFSSSSSPKTSSGGKSSSRHKVVAPARVVGNQLRRNASSFLTLALFNIVVLSIWRFQDGHRSMQANSNAVYNSASYPSAPSPPAGDSPFHLQRPSSHAASHHRRGAQSNGQEVLSPAQHAPGPLATSPLATASCEVCVLNPSDPLCAYGIDNIRLARAYQGSGTRVRRFLEKALRGEKVKIVSASAMLHPTASADFLVTIAGLHRRKCVCWS